MCSLLNESGSSRGCLGAKIARLHRLHCFVKAQGILRARRSHLLCSTDIRWQDDLGCLYVVQAPCVNKSWSATPNHYVGDVCFDEPQFHKTHVEHVLSGRWLSFEKWLAAPECMLEGESKRKTRRKVQVCDFVLGSGGHKDGSFLLWKCQGYSVHMWQHGISRLLWQGLFCTYLTFLRESEKKQKLVAGSWVLLGFVYCTPQVVGRLIVKCRSFTKWFKPFFVGAYSWWSWTNRLGTRHLNGFQRMAMWDIC